MIAPHWYIVHFVEIRIDSRFAMSHTTHWKKNVRFSQRNNRRSLSLYSGGISKLFPWPVRTGKTSLKPFVRNFSRVFQSCRSTLENKISLKPPIKRIFIIVFISRIAELFTRLGESPHDCITPFRTNLTTDTACTFYNFLVTNPGRWTKMVISFLWF